MIPRPEFEIRDSEEAEHLLVSVRGEIDMATAPALETHLERLRAQKRHVRLNLSAVEYMDSTGVRILIDAVTHARTQGVPLGVDDAFTPAVKHLFEVVQLHRLLEDHT